MRLLKENSTKILHIDDDKSFLDVTKIYLDKLSENKLEIESINDSAQFFDRINDFDPNGYDLIICDYEMPKYNGLDLLKNLREKNIQIPFIIFTGRSREDVVIQALNLGADYYVTKGLDAKSQYRELIHAINMVLKQQQTEKALKESEEKYRELFEENPVPTFEWDVSEAKKFIENLKIKFPDNYKVEIMKFSNYYEINRLCKLLKMNKAQLKTVKGTSVEVYRASNLEGLTEENFNNNIQYAYNSIRYLIEDKFEDVYISQIPNVHGDQKQRAWTKIDVFVPQSHRANYNLVWIRTELINQEFPKELIE